MFLTTDCPRNDRSSSGSGSGGGGTAAATRLDTKRFLTEPHRAWDLYMLDFSAAGDCRQYVSPPPGDPASRRRRRPAAGAVAVDGVFPVPGTFKMPGIATALTTLCPAALATYDYFAFVDDDLEFVDGANGVLDAFLYAAAAGLDITQPALTAESPVVIPCTRAVPGNHTVRVNPGTVEVMAPIFSARALARWLPEFPAARSAWGLDARYSLLTQREGGRIGVVDAAQMAHLKPLHGGNLLYRNLPGGIAAALDEFRAHAAALGMAEGDLGGRGGLPGVPTVVSIASLRAESWLAARPGASRTASHSAPPTPGPPPSVTPSRTVFPLPQGLRAGGGAGGAALSAYCAGRGGAGGAAAAGSAPPTPHHRGSVWVSTDCAEGAALLARLPYLAPPPPPAPPLPYAVYLVDFSPTHACAALAARVDGVFHAPGAPKWQGAFDVLRTRCPALLDRHEAFMFADDDVRFPGGPAAVGDLFAAAAAANLTIAQAALTRDSRVSHECTVAQPRPAGTGAGAGVAGGSRTIHLRAGVGVAELMAPVFTRAALGRWLPAFDGTSTAWGLDFLWSLREAGAGHRVGVVDGVAAARGGARWPSSPLRGADGNPELRMFQATAGITDGAALSLRAQMGDAEVVALG